MVRHLDSLLTLSHKELESTRWNPEFLALAEMYHARFQRCKQLFVNKYGNNLLNGFKYYFERGNLELMMPCRHARLHAADAQRACPTRPD